MEQQNDDAILDEAIPTETESQNLQITETNDQQNSQDIPIETQPIENQVVPDATQQTTDDQINQQVNDQQQQTEPTNNDSSNSIYTYTILAKEFIFFSLPYLYFIGAAIYRLNQLKKLQQQNLQRQSIRSQLSDDEVSKEFPPSLNIKVKISYWLCFICTLSMILGFFGLIMTVSTELFFIWLIPIIAHLVGAYLLIYEFRVQEQQAIWTHRIFWPLQTAFLVVRSSQQYQTILSSTLIILQLIPSIILLIYSLYRPNDRVRIPDDAPKFAKSLMKSLEELSIFQSPKENVRESLLKLKDKKVATSATHILSSQFSELIKSKNQTEQEQYLREKLPDRNVTISKKVIKRFVNDNEILYFYCINTSIDEQQFQSEKRYPEFLNIERVQIDHFNKYNAVSFKIHRIDLQLGEDEYSYVLRRREYLERWLQDQIVNPTYITKQLLDFLNVSEESQQPFLLYQQLISKSKSNSRQKSYQRNAQETELPLIKVCSEENLVTLDFSELHFSSSCQQYEYGMYGSNSIEFVINIKYKEKNTEHVYRILRTLSAIKKFSEALEHSTGRALKPNLKVSKQIQNLSTNEKINFVDEFFKELIENQEYYTNEFFEFIGFDISNRCPKEH